MRVKLHAFSSLALDGSEWSASHPDHFTPEERAPYSLDRRLRANMEK